MHIVTALSVNLNKIALLRNSRGTNFPKVLDFADLCVSNGADGVTIHPRPDQRHATYQDVSDLSEFCSHHPHVEFNIEGRNQGVQASISHAFLLLASSLVIIAYMYV